MNPDDLVKILQSKYAGISVVNAWGETSLFYNPGNTLPRGVYFATIKEKDGDNDKASHLNREGIYRLNMGTSKLLFFERFGKPPARPSKGGVIKGDWDFTEVDQLTPHPVYGWMSWVSINNPSKKSFDGLSSFLDGAYEKSITAFKKR